jgi:hypothetical protein
MTQTGLTAFASMNPAMQRQSRAIQELFAKATLDDVATRYEIAGRIRCVQDGRRTFGEHAVDHLAGFLGQARATLYRYAAVARRWDTRKLTEISKRRTRAGLPLTWSHLVLLAPLEEWEHWLDVSLAEGWSVRQLKEELEGATKQPDPAAQGPEASTCAALIRTINDTKRSNARLTTLKPLLERIERSSGRSQETEDLIARLDEAVANLASSANEKRNWIRRLSSEAPARPPAARVELDARRGLLLAGTAPAPITSLRS